MLSWKRRETALFMESEGLRCIAAANISRTGENGSGRGPDAGRTIEFEETDADRTRAWPFLPGAVVA
eukprot:gene9359-biopygen9253